MSFRSGYFSFNFLEEQANSLFILFILFLCICWVCKQSKKSSDHRKISRHHKLFLCTNKRVLGSVVYVFWTCVNLSIYSDHLNPHILACFLNFKSHDNKQNKHHKINGSWNILWIENFSHSGKFIWKKVKNHKNTYVNAIRRLFALQIRKVLKYESKQIILYLLK